MTKSRTSSALLGFARAQRLGLTIALGALAFGQAAAPAAADTNAGLLGWATFPSYPSAATDLPKPPKLAAAPKAPSLQVNPGPPELARAPGKLQAAPFRTQALWGVRTTRGY